MVAEMALEAPPALPVVQPAPAPALAAPTSPVQPELAKDELDLTKPLPLINGGEIQLNANVNVNWPLTIKADNVTIEYDLEPEHNCTCATYDLQIPWPTASAYGNTYRTGQHYVTTGWTKRIRIKTIRNGWGSQYVTSFDLCSDSGTSNSYFQTTVSPGVVANWGYGPYVALPNGWTLGSNYIRPKTKEEEFRERLQANLAPDIVTKNRYLWGIDLTEEEIRARSLLLELIGSVEFRRYLTRGFIMVTGRSGTLYKISGGHNRIVSYKKAVNGKFMPFEEFCVVFSQYDLPFTDGVIMRKLMVEHDEFAMRKKANVFSVGERDKFPNELRAVG